MDPRADSFSLYSGWVANRLLLNLIPKTMLDNKVHRQHKKQKKVAEAAADKSHKQPSKHQAKVSNSKNAEQQPADTDETNG